MEEKQEEQLKDDSPVKPVFSLVYNQKEDRYGIIGTPGFLDDEVRAYGFIRYAEKLLDEYYLSKRRSTNRIISAGQAFADKTRMWNFLRKKR